mgnify:CR=1 FL=1
MKRMVSLAVLSALPVFSLNRAGGFGGLEPFP